MPFGSLNILHLPVLHYSSILQLSLHNSNKLVKHDLFCLNPCWLLIIRLLLPRNFTISSLIILSIIFPICDVRLTWSVVCWIPFCSFFENSCDIGSFPFVWYYRFHNNLYSQQCAENKKQKYKKNRKTKMSTTTSHYTAL